MISFDYLRSARPALARRFLDVRLPYEFKGPLFAIAFATAIVALAWGIESYRLSQTLAVEGLYEAKYSESRLQLAHTKVLFSDLTRIAGLAREVHAIQASGAEEARQLAEIGNRLPAHVWLTSIAKDGTGVSLSGGAANLSALSRTLAQFSPRIDDYSAVLINANGDDRGATVGALHYELRLEVPTQ